MIEKLRLSTQILSDSMTQKHPSSGEKQPTPLFVPFSAKEQPELAQVGGKGYSLILMTQQGLPVPPGFVLTVAFFRPWLAFIKRSPEWTKALAGLENERQDLNSACEKLKALGRTLELDKTQQAVLTDALRSLRSTGEFPLLAVRSSSPEEDLEEASFAGGYETTLGVTETTLESTLRHSFLSSLDQRVLLYKKEKGFDVQTPQIAVIVQKQIDARTAGVAFSINPVNNCYDEVVINANYGLGESVVSGMISPDAFVVDKVSHSILERRPGKKEKAIRLLPGGGTSVESLDSVTGPCLSDDEALLIADVAARVEAAYGKPVDIEWAFAGDTLHLLQARPVTAFFPLPEPLLTAPGEQKRLYLDLTLTKWGMHQPLSVMGTEYLRLMNQAMLKFTMGMGIDDAVLDEVRPTLAGRTYLVISNSIKMQRGKQRVAEEIKSMDTVAAEIIQNIDEDEYVPRTTPPALKGIILKMIRQNLGTGLRALKAYRNPKAFKRLNNESVERLLIDLKASAEEPGPVGEYAKSLLDRMFSYLEVSMPIMIASEINRMRMHGLFKKASAETRSQMVFLERALPDNVTIEMGLDMYRLASFEEIRTCATAEEFVARLSQRDYSAPFLKAWDSFNETYGFRGPGEMDVAAHRFHERPQKLFERLKLMAENTDPKNNPQAIFDRAVRERKQAYQLLLQIARRKSKSKARKFAGAYRTFVELGGYRETPKYYLSLITYLVRRHILEVARSLVEAGRLDRSEQVFDLTFEQLEQGIADPFLDLRAVAAKNTRFPNQLRRLRELPRVVDSRGKILRAPKKAVVDGELVGEAVSPGVVRGRVKVLQQPDEKPVLPGEILVTRATDPGWTPLFLNAGGIVLEVGGALQHGALVAREYGKPCVVGIENATESLADGQLVEMDGANGIVRLL